MSHAHFLASWCRGLIGPRMSNSNVLVQETALLQEQDRGSESVLSRLMLLWETDQISDYWKRWNWIKTFIASWTCKCSHRCEQKMAVTLEIKVNPFLKLQIHANWAFCYFAWNISLFLNWYKYKCLVIRFYFIPLSKRAECTSLTGIINPHSLSTNLKNKELANGKQKWQMKSTY